MKTEREIIIKKLETLIRSKNFVLKVYYPTFEIKVRLEKEIELLHEIRNELLK